MNHKKFFWPSMVSIAILGFIIATVAYFSSTHTFTDLFKTIEYKIETYSLVDSDKAANMWPGQELDSDLIVKNTGQCPVLVRIRYLEQLCDYYYPDVDKDIEILEKGLDERISSKGGKVENIRGTDVTKGIAAQLDRTTRYTFGVNSNYSFLYNGAPSGDTSTGTETYDGCYYYQGILNPGEEVQHIDTVKNSEKSTFNDKQSYKEVYFDKDYNRIKEEGIYHGIFSDFTYRIGWPAMLRAYVETIQATDTTGNYLDSATVKSADVATLKGYWTALGK